MQLLLIEDDEALGQAVSAHLQAAGHGVHWARSLAMAQQAPLPDMALLDLGLPDGDGLDLLTQWRRQGAGPAVIVLTARDQVRDRIRGLQAGADDYLLKPFDLDELLARIEAVARRSQPAAPGRLAIDPADRCVRLDGRSVPLTRMEWALVEVLAGRRGRVYTRSEIEQRLAAEGLADAESNSLEVIVSRLRKKLGAEAIVTHRGLGYSLG